MLASMPYSDRRMRSDSVCRMLAHFGGNVPETDRDFELMKRLARGDDGALEQLFERHGSAVYGLARKIVSDEQLAEEVLQDTFLRVAREAKNYRPSTAGVLPWLMRVGRNAAIDVVRKRKRDRRAAAPEILDILADERVTSALDGVSLDELATEAKKALSELPDGPRRAIDLAYFAGLTQTEIADRLEVPLGTAKTWVRTGLLALREKLGRFLGEPT
jgi:RNA polymerase sigma-70 factor (ECF subfamily)